jgi:hypothetical protein
MRQNLRSCEETGVAERWMMVSLPEASRVRESSKSSVVHGP